MGVRNGKMQLRRLPYSIRRVHAPNIATLSALFLPAGLQDRIPPSPAESDSANLVRARYHAHRIDEAIDQGTRDTLTVFGEPRTQSCRHDGGILGLVDYAERLLRFEWRLDVLQKGNWQ